MTEAGSPVPGFDDAVFISYTHVDNQPFGPDEQRWISHLHEQLTNRVQQLVGDRVSVWRDDKLQGNDVFPETLADRLSKVAILVSVCSPRYLNSEWCQRELDVFLRAAEAGPGVQVGTRSRVFKLLKTPVPLDEQPEPLAPLLGYEFYEESDADRMREFLMNPDPEARWKFYARVDDVAQDIADLLDDMAAASTAADADTGAGRTVYLAESTSDVSAHRDDIKRELQRRGHEVLPHRALPLVAEELARVVRDDLARADLSVHLMGGRYGPRPENDDRSIPHIQLDLAGEVATDATLAQVIWVPEAVQATTDAQAALLERLETAQVGPGVEVVRAPIEGFKSHLLEQLTPPPTPPAPVATAGAAARVYIVHDVGDRDPVTELQAHLEALGHVTMLPLGEGSESEAREVHEMSMALSDAVLIYYGAATEHWLRMKLFDLVKAPGWGRTEPFRAKAVWVAPPESPHKAGYSTNEAMVLDAVGGFEPSLLDPFLAELGSAAGRT